MSREKQIEEMAKVLYKNALTEYCASGRCTNQNCLVNAKALTCRECWEREVKA